LQMSATCSRVSRTGRKQSPKTAGTPWKASTACRSCARFLTAAITVERKLVGRYLRLALEQQVRHDAPCSARHRPTQSAVPRVEIEVGVAGLADDGRAIGRHRTQSAPEQLLLEIAALGKQIAQRSLQRHAAAQ